jgi:hypothetical protein
MDVDTPTHRKVKLMFQECGPIGYWIWHNILCYGYKQLGYYFDTSNRDEMLLFADDICKTQISDVEKVIDVCIRRNLFSKEIYDKYKVLTNDRMQNNYMTATAERRRKGSIIEICKNYLLIEIDDTYKNVVLKDDCSRVYLPAENDNIELSNVKDEQKELKQEYKKLQKTKEAIDDFIKNKAPKFIEPYVDFWNLFAVSKQLSKVDIVTDKRTQKWKIRIQEPSFDFRKIIIMSAKSDFLMGNNDRNFKVSFDWIIKNNDNYVKILEGAYNNTPKPNTPSVSTGMQIEDARTLLQQEE